MNDPKAAPPYESIVLRILWMLVFALVWQVAQFLLGALVVVQLIYRLIYGAPNLGLMNFGDSLSQFLAQIGRFGSFHTEQKPWPFADWPTRVRPKVKRPTAYRRHRTRCVMKSRSYEGMDFASR